ncbi:MAG: OmpA family protein [Gammaproteobacteria bacterium]|jgi:chemotaxis protein MotB
MVDTAKTVNNPGSQRLAWSLFILLAIASAVGVYLYQKALEESRADTRQSRAQVAELEQRIIQLKQDITRLKADLTTERENRRQEVARLTAISDELETKLATEREDRRQEVARLTATSDELESELQQRLTQQERLNRQVNEANDEKQQLMGRLDEAQARRQQLLQQIDEVSGDVEAREAELAGANRDISELKGQLEQNRQQQAMLEARIEQIREEQRQEAQHFADLKQRLENELHESRVTITRMKNRMTVIDMTSEVLFRSGSARITPAGRKVLDVIAASLNAYPQRAISVEGHTDDVPIGEHLPYASNWELSTARALAAVDYLQQENKVAADRLRVVGLGEFHPVASNETPEGRKLNRRIEIRLLPENMEES